MTERWVLSRAGIINVYQYAEETLEFAGGRLLLRGVNGSGKSTAMNMLLPFLLDTNVRRIDAAGEQQNVLRSWMLSGRDEQQPVGYLWIELARGSDHLVCGCGIKANRSTDRVTTWWFVTDRRPGVDLALVEGRVPLSVEALRAALGPHAVFTQDQRPAYRAEVQAQLFGGADLEQHIRLLNVVRNPRVGDRIDVELPTYLEQALPQLSDRAIDDAAQPLEDLEEHRRNVEDMTRTKATLDALAEGYRAYARAELRRRAGALLDAFADVRARRSDEAAARQRAADAARRVGEVGDALGRLDTEQERLRVEIDSLRNAPAYQAGQSLVDLRARVDDLREARDRADGARGRATAQLDQASGRVHTGEAHVEQDQHELIGALADLKVALDATGATIAPVDAPTAGRARLDDGVGPAVHGPDSALDLARVRTGVTEARAHALQRRADVDGLLRLLDLVDRLEAALRQAEADLATAERDVADQDEAFVRARQELATETDAWREALQAWAAQFAAEAGYAGGDDPTPVIDLDLLARPDLVDNAAATVTGLADAATALADGHRADAARLAARRALEQDAADALAAELAELDQRTEPEPPALPWQQPQQRARLADLVDFAPGVEADAAAGLEAALEAAGLLGSELEPDGSIVLSTGELVATPTVAARAPLSALLVVTVPTDRADEVDADAVAALLASVSTSLADDAVLAVTTDGSFRSGVLRGRHHKAVAEHIGVTNRRAALERRRTQVAAQLADATAVVASTDLDVEAARARIDAAQHLRATIPPAVVVEQARNEATLAEERLHAARRTLEVRTAARQDADVSRAEAEGEGRRRALSLGLPSDRDGLAGVGAAVREVGDGCGRVETQVTRLERSHEAWGHSARAWQDAAEAAAIAEGERRRAQDEHAHVAARLATLEEAIGLEYAEVVAALERSETALGQVSTDIEQTRTEQIEAVQAEARDASARDQAAGRRRAAEEACVARLPSLRSALAVPGLVATAWPEPDPSDPGAAPTSHVVSGPETGASSGADREGASDSGTEPTSASGAKAADPADPADPAAEPPGDADLHADADAGPAPARAATSPSPSPSPSAREADTGDVAPTAVDPASRFPTVPETPEGVKTLADLVLGAIPEPSRDVSAEGVRISLRQRRDSLGAGWDAEDHQRDDALPLLIEVTGPLGRMALADARREVTLQLTRQAGLLTAKQDQALRNLLQGLIAKEVVDKLHAARELVRLMNERLGSITTSHGIGVALRWRRKDDLDPDLAAVIDLLAKVPDLRTAEEDARLAAGLSARIEDGRRLDPEQPYRELIRQVLDYRGWHQMAVLIRRPGENEQRLTRRTPLSEGEKKMVSYLPLFAAVAASCDALAAGAPDVPRFVLLDDAFAKVSEDNHAGLFGLLVDLDLDFIATSERLWGTHATVPELAITEVIRDAALGVIVLEHARWSAHDGELTRG